MYLTKLRATNTNGGIEVLTSAQYGVVVSCPQKSPRYPLDRRLGGVPQPVWTLSTQKYTPPAGSLNSTFRSSSKYRNFLIKLSRLRLFVVHAGVPKGEHKLRVSENKVL